MSATVKSLSPAHPAGFKPAEELFQDFGAYIAEDSQESRLYLIIHTDECLLKVPFRDGTPCFAYVYSYSSLRKFSETQKKMNLDFRLVSRVLGIEQKAQNE
jgi:hypothetical protein